MEKLRKNINCENLQQDKASKKFNQAFYHHHHHNRKTRKMKQIHSSTTREQLNIDLKGLNVNSIIFFYFLSIFTILNLVNSHHIQAHQTARATPVSFPGVSRDLASFCAARPSLPIDFATMIVHVKKNVSFNYKLYLFSADHVFQTGQVIPRDDFRIHSFPVKFKRLNEFWGSNVPFYQLLSNGSLIPLPSDQFNLKQFLSLVPLNPLLKRNNTKKKPSAHQSHRTISSQRIKQTTSASPIVGKHSQRSRSIILPELHDAGLPGDSPPNESNPGDFISHDVAVVMEARARMASLSKHQQLSKSEINSNEPSENLNSHINFDRDDQITPMARRVASNSSPEDLDGSYKSNERHHKEDSTSSTSDADNNNNSNSNINSNNNNDYNNEPSSTAGEFSRDTILPVGSFSSFHVNLTYLVRKDYGQLEPYLIRIQVEANQFLINQLTLISNGSSGLFRGEDYDFLSHKLLKDPNTRITAINQIYEDWITRNFYTIVYIQRRLDDLNENGEQIIVNDRLIFRGTSTALLGADQLDYSVRAAAFITEKNGLHYYIEFLTNGKFYLCAVDWTKRPFKIIDSRRFPIKATRTQLDNEELLLCPPAVCYSNQPLDEIVNYGRISLPDKIQRETLILSSSLSSLNENVHSKSLNSELSTSQSYSMLLNETNLVYSSKKQNQTLSSFNNRLIGRSAEMDNEDSKMSSISLDSVIEAVKAGSSQLQARLHLRDWLWTLSRGNTNNHKHHLKELAFDSSISSSSKFPITRFGWRYELARRNDIKVKPDTYGYVLTGHEIDASYRVYNELYLISANHLITINYTMVNETVVSTHPIGEEFFGLSSTLMDPITGAFYDRYANQIYFFKGDRYVGYDYASKKPLEDFLLQAPISESLMQDPLFDAINASGSTYGANNSPDTMPLVSSLPVVGILGRQHQVDGIYHDLSSDLVYVFNGMKFYTFEASEFKNGTFKPEIGSLPQMHCINVHFLEGCNFDEAFQNPCRNDDETFSEKLTHSSEINQIKPLEGNDDEFGDIGDQVTKQRNLDSNKISFNEEQQTKVRDIASRAGLLNLLVENSLLTKGSRALEPLLGDDHTSTQEKIVVYLLMAMIVLTVLVTIVMIVIVINWTRVKLSKSYQAPTVGAQQLQSTTRQLPSHSSTQLPIIKQQLPRPPVPQASLISSPNQPLTEGYYLNNQRQHHSRGHLQQHGSRTQLGQAKAFSSTAGLVAASRANRRASKADIDNSVL